METLQLDEVGVEAAALRAAAILASGGAVIYPTDTLYGLGADAFSDEAVARVYEIKGRWEGKPMHAIVSDVAMATQYGEIDMSTYSLIAKLPKGKVTFVVKKKPSLNTGIVRDIDTFGFRIPDNEFCIAMVKAFGKPVTATSANKSGVSAPAPLSIEAVLPHFDEKARALISLIVDTGPLPDPVPSSVVDLSGETPRLIREGAVPTEALRQAILSCGWQGFDSSN